MKRVLLLASLFACSAFADIPFRRIDANIEKNDAQFHLRTKVRNTNPFRAYMWQGTNTFDGRGLVWTFRYGRNDSADSMTTVTGVPFSTYINFDPSTNAFTAPVDRWYAALLGVTSGVTVSFSEGYITVDRSPEVSAPAYLAGTTAINGNEYGPFTGTFDHWPFATGGIHSAVSAAGTNFAMSIIMRQLNFTYATNLSYFTVRDDLDMSGYGVTNAELLQGTTLNAVTGNITVVNAPSVNLDDLSMLRFRMTNALESSGWISMDVDHDSPFVGDINSDGSQDTLIWAPDVIPGQVGSLLYKFEDQGLGDAGFMQRTTTNMVGVDASGYLMVTSPAAGNHAVPRDYVLSVVATSAVQSLNDVMDVNPTTDVNVVFSQVGARIFRSDNAGGIRVIGGAGVTTAGNILLAGMSNGLPTASSVQIRGANSATGLTEQAGSIELYTSNNLRLRVERGGMFDFRNNILTNITDLHVAGSTIYLDGIPIDTNSIARWEQAYTNAVIYTNSEAFNLDTNALAFLGYAPFTERPTLDGTNLAIIGDAVLGQVDRANAWQYGFLQSMFRVFVASTATGGPAQTAASLFSSGGVHIARNSYFGNQLLVGGLLRSDGGLNVGGTNGTTATDGAGSVFTEGLLTSWGGTNWTGLIGGQLAAYYLNYANMTNNTLVMDAVATNAGNAFALSNNAGTLEFTYPTNITAFSNDAGYASGAALAGESIRIDDIEARTNYWNEAYSWGDHANAGYLTAGTNTYEEIRIARLDQLAGELVSNGTFTGSANSWAISGDASFQSNQVHVPFTRQGTFSPVTNLAIATGHLYRVSFDILTSDSFENTLISMGGDSRSYSSLPSTNIILTLFAYNTNDLVVTCTATVDSVHFDNFSVRETTNGDALVAGELYARNIFIMGTNITQFIYDAATSAMVSIPPDIAFLPSNQIFTGQNTFSNSTTINGAFTVNTNADFTDHSLTNVKSIDGKINLSTRTIHGGPWEVDTQPTAGNDVMNWQTVAGWTWAYVSITNFQIGVSANGDVQNATTHLTATPNPHGVTWAQITGGPVLLDHGTNLTAASLLDDDHTNYFLASGARSMTGSITFSQSNQFDIGTLAKPAGTIYAGSNSVYVGTQLVTTVRISTWERVVNQGWGNIATGDIALSSDVFSGAGTTGQITSAAGDAGKFLRADGTWAVAAGADTGATAVDLGAGLAGEYRAATRTIGLTNTVTQYTDDMATNAAAQAGFITTNDNYLMAPGSTVVLALGTITNNASFSTDIVNYQTLTNALTNALNDVPPDTDTGMTAISLGAGLSGEYIAGTRTLSLTNSVTTNGLASTNWVGSQGYVTTGGITADTNNTFTGTQTVNTINFDAVEENIIINGDFATDSDWDKGTGWSISAGKAHYASDTAGSLTQTSEAISSFPTGSTVRVVFTLSNFSSGTGFAPIFNGVYGTEVNANGTYTQDWTVVFASSPSLVFIKYGFISPGTVSIDDVKLFEVIGDQEVSSHDVVQWNRLQFQNGASYSRTTNSHSGDSYWQNARSVTFTAERTANYILEGSAHIGASGAKIIGTRLVIIDTSDLTTTNVYGDVRGDPLPGGNWPDTKRSDFHKGRKQLTAGTEYTLMLEYGNPEGGTTVYVTDRFVGYEEQRWRDQ